jgi:hypothetical protein
MAERDAALAEAAMLREAAQAHVAAYRFSVDHEPTRVHDFDSVADATRAERERVATNALLDALAKPSPAAQWMLYQTLVGIWPADLDWHDADAVRELAERDYSRTDDRPAVDDVLLFVPNESLAGFIHEADPALIDEAMRQHIVLCSPLTLYAFLGVIRQAHDNYIVEQTSREILGLLGSFNQQWGKYADAVDKVKRQFDTVSRSFDELATTRRRALDRPLRQIEQLRAQQGVAVALDDGRDDGRDLHHQADQGGDAWPGTDTVTDTGALPAGGA